MQKTKTSAISKLMAVLLLISAAASIYIMISGIDTAGIAYYKEIFIIPNIVNALLGALYIITGARKNPGNVIFILFLISIEIGQFLLLFSPQIRSDNISMIFVALIMSLVSFLLATNDLGEKKSKIIGWAVSILGCLPLIYYISSQTPVTAYVVYLVIDFIITLSVTVLIYAKYRDKAARGTK